MQHALRLLWTCWHADWSSMLSATSAAEMREKTTNTPSSKAKEPDRCQKCAPVFPPGTGFYSAATWVNMGRRHPHALCLLRCHSAPGHMLIKPITCGNARLMWGEMWSDTISLLCTVSSLWIILSTHREPADGSDSSLLSQQDVIKSRIGKIFFLKSCITW